MVSVEIGRARLHFRGLEAEALARLRGRIDGLEILDRPLRHATLEGARIQRLDNAALSEWEGGVVDASGATPDFARLERAGVDCVRPRRRDDSAAPPRALDLAIFAGMCFAGYGHILLESLARIWAADLAPSAPIVFLQRKRVPDAEKILCAVAGLLGIDPGRLLFLEGDALCRRLIVPEPGMKLEMSVNRRHFEFLAGRLARRRGRGGAQGTEPPVYLSRSKLSVRHRRPFGETALERALAEEGRQIVHPETLTLAGQAELFDRSDHFAGFIGSQFHNLLFRLRPDPVEIVYLCGEAPSLNFILLDALFPGERHYVRAASFAPLYEFGNRAPFCVDFDAIRACSEALGVDDARMARLALDPPSHAAFAENWFENFFHHKVLRPISVPADMPEAERSRIFRARMDKLMRRPFDGALASVALAKFEQVLEASGLLAPSVTQAYRAALAARR